MTVEILTWTRNLGPGTWDLEKNPKS